MRPTDMGQLHGQCAPRTGTGKVRRLELRNRLLGAADTHGSGRWT